MGIMGFLSSSQTVPMGKPQRLIRITIVFILSVLALHFFHLRTSGSNSQGVYIVLPKPEDIRRFNHGHPRVPPDHPLLVNYIRRYLVAPSNHKLHLYNSTGPDHSQGNQSLFIDDLLGRKRNGFYVECGAAYGEKLSNSLYFEMVRDWSGLLIEADAFEFKGLLKRNRHAYAINACLSPTNTTQEMSFDIKGVSGGLSDRKLGPAVAVSNTSLLSSPFSSTYCQCLNVGGLFFI